MLNPYQMICLSAGSISGGTAASSDEKKIDQIHDSVFLEVSHGIQFADGSKREVTQHPGVSFIQTDAKLKWVELPDCPTTRKKDIPLNYDLSNASKATCKKSGKKGFLKTNGIPKAMPKAMQNWKRKELPFSYNEKAPAAAGLKKLLLRRLKTNGMPKSMQNAEKGGSYHKK